MSRLLPAATLNLCYSTSLHFPPPTCCSCYNFGSSSCAFLDLCSHHLWLHIEFVSYMFYLTVFITASGAEAYGTLLWLIMRCYTMLPAVVVVLCPHAALECWRHSNCIPAYSLPLATAQGPAMPAFAAMLRLVMEVIDKLLFLQLRLLLLLGLLNCCS